MTHMMIELDSRRVCGADVSLYWLPDLEDAGEHPLVLSVEDGETILSTRLTAAEGADGLNHPARYGVLRCNCASCRGPVEVEEDEEVEAPAEAVPF